MSLYTILYDYYDKRGHTRSKKIQCGGLDRLKFYCKEIESLTDKKPIATPLVYKCNSVFDDFGDELDYYDILEENYEEDI